MTTTAASASATFRPRGCFGVLGVCSRAAFISKPDADRKMQAHFARLLAVGDVEAERAGRRFHARADAVPLRQSKMRPRVERVAGVDEGGNAPRIADPARHLDARDGVVAHGEDRVALLQA